MDSDAVGDASSDVGTTDLGVDAEGSSWPAADYIVTAVSVADGCLDGAAELYAIPDTASGMREFSNPLTFPGSADDTFTSRIRLVTPFAEVDVSWVKTDTNRWEWSPLPTNTDVDLSLLEPAWSGCRADFEFAGSFTAQMLADGEVRFVGEATFRATAFNEDAGCPVTAAPLPCDVTLDVIAKPAP